MGWLRSATTAPESKAIAGHLWKHGSSWRPHQGPSPSPEAIIQRVYFTARQLTDPAAGSHRLRFCLTLPLRLHFSLWVIPSSMFWKWSLLSTSVSLYLTHTLVDLLPLGLFNIACRKVNFSPTLSHFYTPLGLFFLKSSVSFLANLSPLSTNTAPYIPHFHSWEHRNDTCVFTALFAH